MGHGGPGLPSMSHTGFALAIGNSTAVNIPGDRFVHLSRDLLKKPLWAILRPCHALAGR